jgi:hypothetical protein
MGRTMVYLQNFTIMNYTGFIKITKKRAKLARKRRKRCEERAAFFRGEWVVGMTVRHTSGSGLFTTTSHCHMRARGRRPRRRRDGDARGRGGGRHRARRGGQ